MSEPISHADAKAGACAYVLHGLLQRLEKANPGLVLDLLNGASADKAAMERAGPVSAPVEQILEETLKLLGRIHQQNQMESATLSG